MTPRPSRITRALASPVGVLVTIPLLVIAVGAVILLVGRATTSSATRELAKARLEEQATIADLDLRTALDQAGPVIERLRSLADPARSTDEVLVKLYDLMLGRAGVAYISISYADGTFRGAYLDTLSRRLEVQESRVLADHTEVRRFVVERGQLKPLPPKPDEPRDYDPRTRPFYALARTTGARAWTKPYSFYFGTASGITCTEPVDVQGGVPRAVVTVDFDLQSLSRDVMHGAMVEGARSLMFAYDADDPASSTILAYSNFNDVPRGEPDTLMHAAALGDAAVTALFASGAIKRAGGRVGRNLGDQLSSSRLEVSFVELATPDGRYLGAVAPVGGARAGIRSPLDWYVATVVPEATFVDATAPFVRTSLVVSAIALAIAVGIALVLAWNVGRMRQQVAAARGAEARARELGSYRLVARLGEGGMGEVWRAEHRLLARTAAIKLIRPEALRDPAQVGEMRERFRREAQSLASMRSRNTIAIYDYGVTDEGTFYYVMELLDGVDLEQLVARFGPQPAARVIPILIQACGSLAEAHEAALYHRDIKPPNLFVSRVADELDVVKLLDFGIVHAANDPRITQLEPIDTPMQGTPKLTQLGSILGTPGFIAPEQILGAPLDGRADLYALGCCAWWLLAGEEVYARTGGDAALLRKHIYDELPSLRARVAGWFPPELEAAIAACLAKQVGDRPPDARTLAARLRAIEIPSDAGWTAADARAWWEAYRAPALTFVAPGEVKVIAPGPTDFTRG